MCWANPACGAILWIDFCRIPTKLLLKFHHLACGQPSNFLTVFLDKLKRTVCICLPGYSFCKGCEFLYIFLNQKILITLKFEFEFLMQNTTLYIFYHSRNVNSCKWNFTNYNELLIRTTNLYCDNTICLNLIHTLPGRRPMSLVTYMTNTKLRFEIFLCCLYFQLYKIFGINFPRNTLVRQLFLFVIFLRYFDPFISESMLLPPEGFSS